MKDDLPPANDPTEVPTPTRVSFDEVLTYIDVATYYELSEIARKAYHLKMEKERNIARKHVDKSI